MPGSASAGRGGKLSDLERYHLESLMRGPLLLLEPVRGLNAQAVERGWAEIGKSGLGETLSITPAGRKALSAGGGEMIEIVRKTPNLFDVTLSGKLVGCIWPVPGGWQYRPKGRKDGGKIFARLEDCKRLVQGED